MGERFLMFDVGFLVLIALVFVVIVAIDVWLWQVDNWKGEWTISEAIRRWNRKLPWIQLVVSFVMGLLVGHWFW